MSEYSAKTLGVTGGCQCGAIRYRAELDLASAHLCHCRMCQKAAGNYFMALASTPKSKFEVTRGTISTFASSAPVTRGFCSQCGTPLTFETNSAPTIAITLGSLDAPAQVEPVVQSGMESRVPWFDQLAGLPTEPTCGGGAELAEIAATNRQHPDHDTLR
jgi:hypothetical protein